MKRTILKKLMVTWLVIILLHLNIGIQGMQDEDPKKYDKNAIPQSEVKSWYCIGNCCQCKNSPSKNESITLVKKQRCAGNSTTIDDLQGEWLSSFDLCFVVNGNQVKYTNGRVYEIEETDDRFILNDWVLEKDCAHGAMTIIWSKENEDIFWHSLESRDNLDLKLIELMLKENEKKFQKKKSAFQPK
jgi:hypothetical protein